MDKFDEDFENLNLEQKVANKESDKLSQIIDEWEKKIRSADAALQIVSEDFMILSQDIIKMRNELSNKRQEQLEVENTVRKGLFNVRKLKSEKTQIERAFWRAK